MTFKAQAALVKGGPLEPFEYEPQELGPMDVEIEISHCGLCHSDIHLIDDSWGRPMWRSRSRTAASATATST